jgi:hypothetical protein
MGRGGREGGWQASGVWFREKSAEMLPRSAEIMAEFIQKCKKTYKAKLVGRLLVQV